MEILPSQLPVASQDVYTDLHSLNKLKNEENTDVALKKVAQEFESIFVNMMMKSMRSANAVFEKDSLFQSNESKMYRDMYDQQLSLTMAKGRGIGIADALYKQLKGQYGDKPESTDASTGEFSINKAYELAEAKPIALETRLKPTTIQPASAPDGEVKAPLTAATEKAQPAPFLFATGEEFVKQILPAAKNLASALGLDPLVMVAQAALETGWGKHIVQSKTGSSYNLFNIKADSSWAGDSVSKNTLEYKDGVAVKESAQFRRYRSFAESLKDFVHFVRHNPRYQTALKSAADPKAFIGELHKAGYATDPNYADKVLSVFKRVQTMVASKVND